MTLLGPQTLRFRGAEARYAITRDFDLRHGGELEFHMMYVAQSTSRESPLPLTSASSYGSGQAQGCAKMEFGLVTLDFSTDGGQSWEEIATYERAEYVFHPVEETHRVSLITHSPVPCCCFSFRKPNFTHVRVQLNHNASTPATRFRWWNKSWWDDFDVWALDAIKVFQYLEPSWETSSTFQQFKEDMQAQELKDSCCMDCNTCEFPHEIEDPDECHALPGFTQLPVHTAMEHELVVLAAGILGALHLAYVAACVVVLRNCVVHVSVDTCAGCRSGLSSTVPSCSPASSAGPGVYRRDSMMPHAENTLGGWLRTHQRKRGGETWSLGCQRSAVHTRWGAIRALWWMKVRMIAQLQWGSALTSGRAAYRPASPASGT